MIDRNKIKLIASDMDMTLMNADRKISEKTAKTLIKLEKKGIIIVIATGRMYQDIEKEMKNIGIKPYYILINGAEARDNEGNLLSYINLSDDSVKKVLTYFETRNMIAEVYTSDGEYLVCDEEESIKEFALRSSIMKPFSKLNERELRQTNRYKNRKYLKSIDELTKKDIGIRKIIYFDKDKDIITKCKQDLNPIKDIATLSSCLNNIEITNIKAQKGYILEDIIAKMNIKKDEVVVFGDGENDLSLFEKFTHSVAVENALPMIKKRAKYITIHHNDDGVSRFIEEELL